jgi:hypothetical protein
MGAFDVPVGELADMNEPRVLQTDIDKGAEVDHVENGPLEFHSGGQILEFENAFLENRFGKIVSRITLGAAQSLDDIPQREFTDCQFLGEFSQVGRGELLVDFRETVSVANDVWRKLELGEQGSGGLIAFWVHPGPVKRVGRVKNLQESSGLRERGRADALNLRQLTAIAEWTFFLPVIDDPPRGELIEARDVSEQRHARGIQVDSNKIDATGDDRLEGFLELLGIDIVLVEPDTDVLRLDLDQFRQRVLEPAADRDGRTERRVEFGQFLTANLAGRVDAGPCFVDDHVGELCQEMIGVMRGRWDGRRWWSGGRSGALSSRSSVLVAPAPAL